MRPLLVLLIVCLTTSSDAVLLVVADQCTMKQLYCNAFLRIMFNDGEWRMGAWAA